MNAPRRPVRLIGLPTDANSSHLRGAAAGPAAIRAALLSDAGNLATESGLEIGREITLKEGGDLPLDGTPADDALIAAAVAEAARAGALPLCLGGDHSVTAPVLAGLAAVHGPLNVLHIDAHPDLYHDFGGNPRSHASPFARIMEAGSAARLVQVGIRAATRHLREQAARFGVETVAMRDFAVAAVPVLAGPLYLSIDLDGLDPAFAPGVVHHEPGGLSVRDLLALIARQTAWLAGADIVELHAGRDINGMTAAVAAKLVKEIAALPGAA